MCCAISTRLSRNLSRGIEPCLKARDEPGTRNSIRNLFKRLMPGAKKAIYARHRDNPKIRWKDSIKKVVGIKGPGEAGMDT